MRVNQQRCRRLPASGARIEPRWTAEVPAVPCTGQHPRGISRRARNARNRCVLAGINADSGFPSLCHRSATSDGLRGGSDTIQQGCNATTCGKGPGMLTFPLPTPIRPASQPRASQGYALSRDHVRRRCLETAKLRPSELPSSVAAQPAGSYHGAVCIKIAGTGVEH